MSEEKSTNYVDEEKITALELAVQFWSSTNQNPNTTPATVKKVLETADHFYYWITNL